MDSSSLVYQGLELAIIGMGTVFGFLTLMVIVTAAMSRVIGRFFPEPEPALRSGASAAPRQDADGEAVAAIAAALRMHRKRR